MSRHSDLIRLRHMLDHAPEAAALVQGKTRGDLANTRLLQLGLVRLVEIIGEAGARVSKDMQTKHTSIPWEDVVGMRNKLIHGYDQVDLGILWDTATDDLPQLIQELEAALATEPEA
jgi:uncharacterized protein with HEPN domain